MRARPEPVPLAAVLFDMDGTITDTEGSYIGAFEALATAHGRVLTDGDRRALVGASLESMFTTAAAAGIPVTPGDLTTRIIEAVLADVRREVSWLPGALGLLRELKAAGIPTALVTMSHRVIADAVAERIPFRAFDTVVAGDEVARGKPDPEAYDRAARLLGVDISGCVVIEDSATGVAAGVASGARVVAVPWYLPLPESPSYTLWPDGLAGKHLTDLAAQPRPPAVNP